MFAFWTGQNTGPNETRDMDGVSKTMRCFTQGISSAVLFVL